MKPITRKELYLNKIVGNNDYETPEKPITTEEFFFAEILGEAVQAPEPLTRYQMYLAKIAGREIEIPYPEVRLEFFLAKAAGMNIETPTPITREEIFWSNYRAIVDFEVEGVPPLTYKAIEGTLENYRIYGDTVNGENVGDLITEGEHAGEYSVPVTVTNGTNTETTNIYLPEQIKKVGDEAEYMDYTDQKLHRVRANLSEVNEFSNSITDTSNKLTIWVQQGKDQSFEFPSQLNIFTITEPTTITTYITITNGNDSIRIKHNGSQRDIVIDIVRGLSPGVYSVSFNVLNYDHTTVGGVVINNIMVNKGSAPFPYEPYIENTDIDVTLPELPTLTGTNVLTVGTVVQPSKVYIKGQKERGD